jgi:hypothetical protein
MGLLRTYEHRFSHLRAILFAAVFLLLSSTAAVSQIKPTPTPPQTDPSSINQGKSDPPTGDFGSVEGEMRARLALKAEKKEYDENLARAREAAQLANELDETYGSKKAFANDDTKKIERLEKITRKIRNEAGGSETDPDVKEIPNGMPAAVKRLAEVAEDLRKLVEKTPRHVVSASVIDQANTLLCLIQHIRSH